MSDRNQAILMQHIGGETFRELGARYDLSAMGCHAIFRREARQHVESVLLQMWAAQKEDALLVLAVPSALDQEQQLAYRYVDWLLGALVEEGAEPHVHYRPAGFDGGFVMALEDRAFTKLIEEHTR
jgi:hypothetical protein